MALTYLALGDSYTIGEQVLITESFPYQTVQLLRQASVEGAQFTAPELIAKTGWTTDELTDHIKTRVLLPGYDMVSLLIGVNNQYRGRSVEEFAAGFEELLQMAIGFAAGEASHVFVLSIPDWGLTPFAQDRDRVKIGNEIDQFNAVCELACKRLGCQYIDITSSQRRDATRTEFLATDGLHPSGKEYAKWAELLSQRIMTTIRPSLPGTVVQ